MKQIVMGGGGHHNDFPFPEITEAFGGAASAVADWIVLTFSGCNI
jgi:hypothetical protein